VDRSSTEESKRSWNDFESIIDALQKGDKIEIRGFGSFRIPQRRGRIGRNPKTAKRWMCRRRRFRSQAQQGTEDFCNTSATAAQSEAAQS